MYYDIDCPKCGATIMLEVDAPERLVYWEECCEECNYKFTPAESQEIYSTALTDCYATIIDRAHDFACSR